MSSRSTLPTAVSTIAIAAALLFPAMLWAGEPSASTPPVRPSVTGPPPDCVPLEPGQSVRFNRDGITKFADTKVIHPAPAGRARLAVAESADAPPVSPDSRPPAAAPPFEFRLPTVYDYPYLAPWYAPNAGWYPFSRAFDPYGPMTGLYDSGFDAGRRETLFKGALDMYNERMGNAPAAPAAAPGYAGMPYAFDPAYSSGYRSGQYLAEAWLARDRNVLRTARASLDRGVAMFRAGRYQDALDAFRLAASSNQGDAASRLLVGNAYFALGRYHNAMSFIRRAFELQPAIARLDFDIRNEYGDAADFDRHFEALRKAAADRPGDARVWALLGYMQRFSGRRNESTAALKKAYRLDTTDVVVRSLLDVNPDPAK